MYIKEQKAKNRQWGSRICPTHINIYYKALLIVTVWYRYGLCYKQKKKPRNRYTHLSIHDILQSYYLIMLLRPLSMWEKIKLCPYLMPSTKIKGLYVKGKSLEHLEEMIEEYLFDSGIRKKFLK